MTHHLDWLYGVLAAILLICVVLTYGCASQFGPTGMSPDQIREWAKVKDLSAYCVKGTYAGANVFTSGVNIDKGIPSGMIIKDDCTITVTPPNPNAESIRALRP